MRMTRRDVSVSHVQGRSGRWRIGQFQEVGVWRREATVTWDKEAERKGVFTVLGTKARGEEGVFGGAW